MKYRIETVGGVLELDADSFSITEWDGHLGLEIVDLRVLSLTEIPEVSEEEVTEADPNPEITVEDFSKFNKSNGAFLIMHGDALVDCEGDTWTVRRPAGQPWNLLCNVAGIIAGAHDFHRWAPWTRLDKDEE
jgi:hypothetical protein